MLKIIHLISTLDRGGAEISLSRLVSNMDKYRFSNIVVSLKNVGPVGREIQNEGISVFPLNMKKGFPDPRGILTFNRILQRFRPDIIQCWLYHANLFGALFKHKAKILWNIRCSNMDLKTYGIIYRWTVKLGALFSSVPQVVISNSRSGLIEHKALGFHSKRWKVIPNGFDTNQFCPNSTSRKEMRTELGILKDSIVIGRIARFDPMKGYQSFFKAVSRLHRNHPDVHFIVAGKGITKQNSELMNMIDRVSITNIHFLGERDDIHRIYPAMDIVSSTSAFGEGFPNNIGEAMSSGLPCVVTDVGDSKCIVNGTGIVIPKDDPIAIAQAWNRLINAGPDERKKMGVDARRRIQKHYNLASSVKEYEELYQDLVPESCMKIGEKLSSCI